MVHRCDITITIFIATTSITTAAAAAATTTTTTTTRCRACSVPEHLLDSASRSAFCRGPSPTKMFLKGHWRVVKGWILKILAHAMRKIHEDSKGTHPDNTTPILQGKCIGGSKRTQPDNRKPKL